MADLFEEAPDGLQPAASTRIVALAAGTALACPGEGKSMDAKVDLSPSVAAALAAKAPCARWPSWAWVRCLVR